MNDEMIIAKGYKECGASLLNKSIIQIFQKRFDDDIGKKYFIDINKWSWKEFGREELPDYTYEFEIQLYSKDLHEPLNLNFFSGWDIDKVERYVESIWNNGMFDYYEKWSEC